MKPFEFTNPAVKAKYQSVFGVDKKITIHRTYSGYLSNITPEAAEKLIQLKDNQIKLIDPVPAVEPAPEKKSKDK